MTALREAAQQALEAWDSGAGPCREAEVFEALRAALAQQAEPVAVAERERIAAQWDGCVTHQLDTFGPVDIGASIRAGELVEPAQQAEPVATLTAQRDALLEALQDLCDTLGECGMTEKARAAIAKAEGEEA